MSIIFFNEKIELAEKKFENSYDQSLITTKTISLRCQEGIKHIHWATAWLSAQLSHTTGYECKF